MDATSPETKDIIMMHTESEADWETVINGLEVTSGIRYRAIDDRSPQWMHFLETSNPAQSEYAYRSTFTSAKAGSSSASLPAEILLLAAILVRREDEAEFNEWYEGEHLEDYRQVPGWLRLRRYRRRVNTDSGDCVQHLSFHEWSHAEFAETPEFVHMTTNANTEQWKAVLPEIEVRVFEKSAAFARQD